jgi:hypothetical protein
MVAVLHWEGFCWVARWASFVGPTYTTGGAVARLMAIMGSGVDGCGSALGGLRLGCLLGLLRRPNLRDRQRVTRQPNPMIDVVIPV